MTLEEKTTSPFARVALAMACFTIVVALLPLPVGIISRMVSGEHFPGRALAIVWAAFIVNTFVLAPVTLLVIIVGFVHVLRSRHTLSGVGLLTGSLIMAIVSAGGCFWLVRGVFANAM